MRFLWAFAGGLALAALTWAEALWQRRQEARRYIERLPWVPDLIVTITADATKFIEALDRLAVVMRLATAAFGAFGEAFRDATE